MNPRPLLLLPTALLLLTSALCAQEKGDGGDKGAKPAKPEAAKPAGDKVDFAAQVLPILEKNCVECHKTAYTDSNGKQRRPKGGVIFDTKAGIMASKKGKLVIAKKPDDSKLIAAISLPADDEDRMPPAKKGDPLPKDQIDLLKKWIEQGADFGTWTGAAEKGKDGKETKDGKDGKKPEAGKDKGEKGKGDKGKGEKDGKDAGHGKDHGDVRALGVNLAPLADSVFEQLATMHAHADDVADECPLVRVSFLGNEDSVDDAAVAKLQCAQEHIAELVLARTPITDAACAAIAQLPNLVHLDLRETRIGDAGVAQLAALPHLRSLNLFGTQVGDAGIAALAQCAELEHLYVWQTPVSASAVVALQRAQPDARIVFAADLPEPLADEATNGRGRRNR